MITAYQLEDLSFVDVEAYVERVPRLVKGRGLGKRSTRVRRYGGCDRGHVQRCSVDKLQCSDAVHFIGFSCHYKDLLGRDCVSSLKSTDMIRHTYIPVQPL